MEIWAKIEKYRCAATERLSSFAKATQGGLALVWCTATNEFARKTAISYLSLYSQQGNAPG